RRAGSTTVPGTDERIRTGQDHITMWKICVNWFVGRFGLKELFGEPQRIPFCVKPGLGVLPGLIVFTFLLQVLVGFFIWMGYGASSNAAWESIYYLKYEVVGGWLLHGLHFWTAQLLLAELFAYLTYLIVMGKYRAPREMVFWSALGMTLAVLASHITGDLLTWTQNGFWSTDVRTKFLQMIPWIGGGLYKLAVGGPQMTQMTLARLQAFHIGLFVVGFLGCAVAHWWFARIAAIREAEILNQPEEKSTGWNVHGLVWLVVAVLLIAFVWAQGGAHLGSPRDPTAPYAAARPHWYLAGVYEFAHFFSGDYKIYAIFVIPGAVIGFYFLAPWFARWLVGHFVVVGATAILIVGVTYLTFQLWAKDAVNVEFQTSLAEENAAAERIVVLAGKNGIPKEGALQMLWNDPETMGPRLFRQHCVSCHDFAAQDGTNGRGGPGMTSDKPTAPNLYGFASEEWLTDFHDPELLNTPRFFGNTRYGKHTMPDGTSECGSMIQFLEGTLPQLFRPNDPDSDDFNEYDEERTEEEAAQNVADFERLMELFAQERFAVPGSPIPEKTVELMAKFTCTSACHGFYDDAINAERVAQGRRPRRISRTSADLTGYGSKAWLVSFIADPTKYYTPHETTSEEPVFSTMAAYLPDPDDPEKNLMTAAQLDLLAEWLWRSSVGPEAAEAARAETLVAEAPAAKTDVPEAEPVTDPKTTLKTNQEVFPPERTAKSEETAPATDDGGFDFDTEGGETTPATDDATVPEAPVAPEVPADDFDFDV
ncbi:MAG: cytochrome b N-terminal domain-containing protein, partial [Planctomycetia bacterium]|nr:cytochrome b N-terminal domain-containing protein [Planctomycetia bacterium]